MANHPPKIPNEELHQAKGGGGGKGCLIRHHPREKGHHCSHQWMAQERAEGEDKGVYNYPAYDSLCTTGTYTTGAYVTRKQGIFPPGHGMTEPRPNPYEWDVGSRGNFEHYLKPYWHNAHHLVPNGTLKRAIDGAGDDKIADLIRQGLLMGEYNLNDKANMMILPMGAAVADAMGLPRHLHGDQGVTRFSHPDYDARVLTMLKPVMDQYAAMVKNKSEDHKEPPTKLAKDQLISISDTIHSAIKALKKRRALRGSLDSVFGTS